MPISLPVELDRLASELLEYAREALVRDHHLCPLAAGIGPSGELEWCAVEDHDEAEVKVAAEIETLVAGLARDAKSAKFQATGIVCAVKVTPPNSTASVNAVEVRLDHKRGESIRIYVPFTVDEYGVSFQKMFTTDGDSSVFHPGLVSLSMKHG